MSRIDSFSISFDFFRQTPAGYAVCPVRRCARIEYRPARRAFRVNKRPGADHTSLRVGIKLPEPRVLTDFLGAKDWLDGSKSRAIA